MTQKINYSELEEKLRNLDIPDEELAEYFVGNPD